MTQYALELKDAHRKNVLNDGDTAWTCSNAPAYFDFSLAPDQVLKGLVNFEFHANGLGESTPNLLFDYGQGFDSALEHLMNRVEPTRYKIKLRLGQPPQVIRLLMPQITGAFKATHLHAHSINLGGLPIIVAKKVSRKLQTKNNIPAPRAEVMKKQPVVPLVQAPSPTKPKKFSVKSRSLSEKNIATSLGHPNIERDALLKTLRHRPSFSIIIPLYNSDPGSLKATLLSLENQSYRNFDVIIFDDGSTNETFKAVYETIGIELKAGGKIDPKHSINGSTFRVSRDQTGGEARALNTTLASIRTSESMIVDPGTIFKPMALGEIVLAQSYNGACRVFYCDAQLQNGDTVDLQPSFSIQNLCSKDFLSSAVVFKTSDLRKVKGWKIKRTGVHRLDIILRLYEMHGENTFCRIGQTLVHIPSNPQSRSGPRLRVVREFLLRQSHLSTPISTIHVGLSKTNPDIFQLSPQPVDKNIVISIIVNLIDLEPKRRILNRLFEGIFSKDMSPHIEVTIVSDDLSANHPYIKRLVKLNLASINVQRDGESHNMALQRSIDVSSSSVVGIIRGDCTINSSDWLDSMVPWAMNPLVGACAASSLEHLGTPKDGSMKSSPIVDTRFMFLSRESLDAISGLDPNKVNELIDIDLGLRLWNSGRHAINVPTVVLKQTDGKNHDPVEATKATQIENLEDLWGSDLAKHPQYFSKFLPKEA